MGSIIFLILRLGFGFDGYDDAQVFSLLVSLDSIALIFLYNTFRRKKE